MLEPGHLGASHHAHLLSSMQAGRGSGTFRAILVLRLFPDVAGRSALVRGSHHDLRNTCFTLPQTQRRNKDTAAAHVQEKRACNTLALSQDMHPALLKYPDAAWLLPQIRVICAMQICASQDHPECVSEGWSLQCFSLQTMSSSSSTRFQPSSCPGHVISCSRYVQSRDSKALKVSLGCLSTIISPAMCLHHKVAVGDPCRPHDQLQQAWVQK